MRKIPESLGRPKKAPPPPEAKPKFELLKLFSPGILRSAAALFVFVLLQVSWRWKAVAAIDSSLLGGWLRDAGLYYWLMQVAPQSLLQSSWFDTAAFYPYSNSLAWSDNFILPSLTAQALSSFNAGPIRCYNILLLSAGILNGWFTWRLCYRLNGNFTASLCGGAAFMGLSWLSGNLGHPQLQFAFFLPMLMELSFIFIASRSLLTAVCMGICLGLCFLCSVYYSVFAGVLLLLAFAALILVRPASLPLAQLPRLGIAVLAGLLPFLPFIIPYFAVRQTFGGRHIYEAYYFSASALSYLSASPFNWLYKFTSSLSQEESQLFPGLLLLIVPVLAYIRTIRTGKFDPLSLSFAVCFCLAAFLSPQEWSRSAALFALLRRLCPLFMWLSLVLFSWLLYRTGRLERKLKCHFITNRDIQGIFLFCALGGFLLSLGPQGNPASGENATGIYSLFYFFFPGFNSIRAISRIGVVVLFCLSVLFSLVLTLHLRKRNLTPILAILLGLAVCIENTVSVYPLDPPRPAPVIFEKLSQLIQPGEAALVLPWSGEISQDGGIKSWGDFAEKNVSYMNWTANTNITLINGYSGQRSKIMLEWPGKLHDFPSKNAVRLTSKIAGLRYIIYCAAGQPGYDREAFKSAVEASSPELLPLFEDEGGNWLFRVNPVVSAGAPDYYLLTPSKRGELHLEIKAEGGSEKARLTILSQQDKSFIEVADLLINADAQWHPADIALPDSWFPVRPAKLVFRVHDDRMISLRGSRFLKVQKR